MAAVLASAAVTWGVLTVFLAPPKPSQSRFVTRIEAPAAPAKPEAGREQAVAAEQPSNPPVKAQPAPALAQVPGNPTHSEAVAHVTLGRELFLREWLPNDARSHGGDGLGPMFNDSSCVACHNLGAPGGGGPSSKNVAILTVTGIDPASQRPVSREIPPNAERDGLGELHPGFRTGTSVVLHRFGLDPDYERWRLSFIGLPRDSRLGAQASTPTDARLALELVKNSVEFDGNGDAAGGFRGRRSRVQRRVHGGSSASVARSERNPTALFGIGLIDAISDAAIEAAAAAPHRAFPEIKGRVCRLEGRRIGRFGWKAQTPTLQEFVLTACAVELGLEVPDHPQGGDPLSPKAKAPGLDLSGAECDALVGFVRSLPAPGRQKPKGGEPGAIGAGEALFASVGCAACHTADLGEARGIYSDLLLHDMGQETGDTGSYSQFRPTSPGQADRPPPDLVAGVLKTVSPPLNGASRQEWRTPPLWGVRDSGPYLHDGRAQTLEQAIAMHGGEASNTALRYFALSPECRGLIVAFLKTLAAPVDRDAIATAQTPD